MRCKIPKQNGWNLFEDVNSLCLTFNPFTVFSAYKFLAKYFYENLFLLHRYFYETGNTCRINMKRIRGKIEKQEAKTKKRKAPQ